MPIVSCTSATFCTAVGGDDNSDPIVTGDLALLQDGSQVHAVIQAELGAIDEAFRIALAQRDVDDSFAAFVPVEVQNGGKSVIYWLATGSDPASFSIPLKSPPTKVSLVAADCLMTISK